MNEQNENKMKLLGNCWDYEPYMNICLKRPARKGVLFHDHRKHIATNYYRPSH